LRPKTGGLLFGQLVSWKIYIFQFFLLDEWTTYFTSFSWTPSTSNSNSVWACGKVLFKIGIKFNFHVFYEELLHVGMWQKLPKGWRAGYLKRSLFCPQKSWIFTFFQKNKIAHGSTWCYLQCDCFDLNLKFLIFAKKFYKFHSVRVLRQDPVNKKNSSSSILTNLKLRFKPCMPYLV
jgi:hypothetical protein